MTQPLRALRLLAPAVVAGACTPAASAPGDPLTPARVVVAAEPSATSPQPPLPPPLQPEVACKLTSRAWPHTARLRAEQQGTPLVTIGSGPSLEAALHTGEPVAAKVRLAKQGVHIFGWFAHDELPLHLVEAKVLAGVVSPASHASLRWGTSEAGRLQVGYAFEDAIAPGEVVWSALDCGEVGLDYATYDHLAVLPDGDPIDEAMVTAATAVPVAPTPGGSAEVSLELAEDLEVDVLEREGDQTRILLELADGHLFGWVHQRFLAPVPQNSIGSAFGVGGLGLRGVGKSAELFECPSELPLHAEKSGEAIAVGSLDPGVLFGIAERGKAFTTVELREVRWVQPLPGVRLTVPSDALDGCGKARRW